MPREDDNGQEKTEDPSGRKLEQSKDEGQVPKSRELPAAMTIAALLLFCYTIGRGFFFELGNMFKYLLGHLSAGEINITIITNSVQESLAGFMPYFWAFCLLMVIAAVSANLAITGLVFSTKSLEIDFTRINPISKFQQIFMSLNSVVELVKSLAKIIIFMLICAMVIYSYFPHIMAMSKLPSSGAIMLLAKIFLEILRNCAVFYLILGIADWAYQKWKFNEDMMMTKQEAKDDFKNTEGDPKVKGQQRRKRMEILSGNMKQEVQGADVVITNPTHFAVAIKYDESRMNAPMVVAKGADYMALQIKKVAKDAGVTVYEAPPLARFLFSTVEIGREIPEEAYKSVAEILVFVFKQKGKYLGKKND